MEPGPAFVPFITPVVMGAGQKYLLFKAIIFMSNLFFVSFEGGHHTFQPRVEVIMMWVTNKTQKKQSAENIT